MMFSQKGGVAEWQVMPWEWGGAGVSMGIAAWEDAAALGAPDHSTAKPRSKAPSLDTAAKLWMEKLKIKYFMGSLCSSFTWFGFFLP